MDKFTSGNLFNAKGLIAVITGGGSGLGLAMARGLAANGASAVYIVGRRKETLEKAAQSHDAITPLVGDTTSKDSLQEIANHIRAKHGYLDLLIANAGIVGLNRNEQGVPKGSKPSVQEWCEAMWKPDMEEYTNTMHVNVTATFYTCVAFLPLLDEGNKRRDPASRPQRSQIVITSSIAGFLRDPTAGYAYDTSKAAVNAQVKQLSTTCAPWGIRVNAIAPGMFLSEMTAAMGGNESKAQEGSQPDNPIGRWGREEEMAGALMFLCSPAGAYMNGNILIIDGGRLGTLPATY